MKEFINGSMKLQNRDCMGGMAEYPDNYFDLAIVDPPYGIDVTKMNMGGRKTVARDDSKNWDSAVPDEKYFNELFRVSKNQIVWGGNYFKLPCSQYFSIWDKGETMYGRDFAECEYAWVRSGGTRIFKSSPNQLDRIHPTQKLKSLYSWLLKNYSSPEHKILDTHLGSASHAIAWHYFQKGGEFVGFELDEEYFEKSIKRIEQETAQISMF